MSSAGKTPAWNIPAGVTGPGGRPLTTAEKRRYRARQAEARGEAARTPLDRSAQALARADLADARLAEIEADAERAEQRVAEAERRLAAMLAEENARRALAQSESPIPRQSSSTGDVDSGGTSAERARAREAAGVGPYANDPRYHPEAQAALAEGGIPAFNAKLREIEAEQQRAKVDQAERERTMWYTRDDVMVTDDRRAPVQASVLHRGWSSFPEYGGRGEQR